MRIYVLPPLPFSEPYIPYNHHTNNDLSVFTTYTHIHTYIYIHTYTHTYTQHSLSTQPSKTHPSISLVLQGTAPLKDDGEVDEALEGSMDAGTRVDDESAFDDAPGAAAGGGGTGEKGKHWTSPFSSKDSGLEVRFKLEKFKSNGDKGTKVPKAGLNEVSLCMSLGLSDCLSISLSIYVVTLSLTYTYSLTYSHLLTLTYYLSLL